MWTSVVSSGHSPISSMQKTVPAHFLSRGWTLVQGLLKTVEKGEFSLDFIEATAVNLLIQWLAKIMVIWSIYLINLVFLTKVFEL